MLCLKTISSPIIKHNRGRILLLAQRKKSSEETQFNPEQIEKFVDIKIPVPWGFIAGKWWGPLDKRPIICIHGWQDNCNTYDELIPLLPDHIPYLAIDYPGHGLSSQIPPGMFYYPMEVPVLLRRLQKYFNWSQVSILAHSVAANLSFLFASVYPKDVDFFIALDGMKPYSKEPGGFIDKTARNIDLFLKYDEINSSGKEAPAYTEEVILRRIHDAATGSVHMNKAEILHKRGTNKSKIDSNKFYFNRDIRHKANSIICWQNEDLKEYAKRVICPMIVIRSLGSKYVEREKYVQEFVDLLKLSNENFSYKEVDGKHHVHLNEPEKVSNIINEFIVKYDTNDRYLGGVQPGLIIN